MNKMIRLVIADDNPHARHGLRAVLASQPGIEVVGESSHGKEAIALVETMHPDVALLDVRMPIIDGLEATRLIKSRWQGIKVILLSMYAFYEEEAWTSGADAFLVKGCPADELISTILGTNPTKSIKQERTRENHSSKKI